MKNVHWSKILFDALKISVSYSDPEPDPDWIRIQGVLWIRIQGLKKRSKLSNNHNIILFFSDFYTILLTF